MDSRVKEVIKMFERMNAMKQRIIISLLAVALICSFAACGTTEQEGAAAVSSGTYTGTVTAISQDSLTLSTDSGDIAISLTDETVYDSREQPPELPEGENGNQSDNREQPPELPEGENGNQSDSREQPPELPEGENGNQSDNREQPPELPDGESNTGNMGDVEPGQAQSITLSDISIGDEVTVVVNDSGTAETVTLQAEMGQMQGGGEMPGGAPGNAGGVDSYDAVTEFTGDTTETDGTYTSIGVDENVVLVSGGDVTLENAEITRDSDSSTGGDNSSFYGVGAAALVTEGSLTITGSTIDTNAAGGAGVFAYGDGVAYVSDTTIRTQQNTSGGIHVAGGGTLYAWDLDVETQGESSAAIRSDRGSGTMVVDGGTYVSNGVGSPAVYSTADITVHDAVLTANGSEAICIEGLNTIRLFDCDLTGAMEDLSQNDCTWNVILYQSMSGDSEIGNSTFQMVGGSLTANNGGMFYTTNTESTFILSGVDITCAEDNAFFLKCTGNSNQRGWGTAGQNGANCTFTAIAQEMTGDVIWDSISTLDFYMTQGSMLTGALIQDESNAGSGGDGTASVYIDADSTWIVTGDSVLTNLYCEGTIVDESGNTVSVVGTDGAVYVQGTSTYTVTVGSYETNANLSGASTVDAWESYAVEK